MYVHGCMRCHCLTESTSNGSREQDSTISSPHRVAEMCRHQAGKHPTPAGLAWRWSVWPCCCLHRCEGSLAAQHHWPLGSQVWAARQVPQAAVCLPAGPLACPLCTAEHAQCAAPAMGGLPSACIGSPDGRQACNAVCPCCAGQVTCIMLPCSYSMPLPLSCTPCIAAHFSV